MSAARTAGLAALVAAVLVAAAAGRALAQPAEPGAVGAGADANLGGAPEASASVVDGGAADGGAAVEAGSAAGAAGDAGAEASADAGAAPGPASSSGSAAGSASSSGSAARPPITVDIPLDADAPTVRAAPENTSPQLGEPFTLFVFSESGPGVVVNLREPVDLGPAFEVRRQVSSIKRRSDGGQLVEWQLEVMAWEVGDLLVPPIAVTFTSGGRAGQVHTKPAPVRIAGLLAEDDDGKQLRGLAPPTALYRRELHWPWIIGGGLALGLFAGGLAWRWTRRRPAPAVSPVVRRLRGPSRPGPLALERLAELEASGRLLSQQRAAYGELAEIARDLLGAYTGKPVAELTTAELLAAVAAHPATRHAEEPLREWMRHVDRVKYAGERADQAQVASVLAGGRALVGVVVERPLPDKGEAATAGAAATGPATAKAAPTSTAPMAAPTSTAPMAAPTSTAPMAAPTSTAPMAAPPAEVSVWARPARPAALLVDDSDPGAEPDAAALPGDEEQRR